MIRPKVSMSGLSMMPSSRSMRCPETYQAPLMSAFTLGALKSTSITSFWSFLVSLYIYNISHKPTLLNVLDLLE